MHSFLLGLLLITSSILSQTCAQNTELESRSKYNASSFVYDLDGAPQSFIVRGPGGTIRPLTLSQMPSLTGQGLAYVLIELAPCGLILPETHPRATEMIYVIEGERLQVGFSEENGGRTLVNEIRKGQCMLFPASLIHFEQNLACTPVKYLAALNSEDPGVVTMSWQTFGLPEYALQSTFNVNSTLIDMIKRGLPVGPAAGFGDCLKKCNLATTTTPKAPTTTTSQPSTLNLFTFLRRVFNAIREFLKNIF